MSNPFKLEFTLKQHTPIIHFQHEQEGATLRATELKPKLDRFLIERYRQEIEPFIRKTASGDEYLDYKVRIDSNQGEIFNISIDRKKVPKINQYKDLSIPSFFANLGITTEKEAKCAVFTDKDIKVYFRCFQPDLKDHIEKKFPLFMVLTNFGTRQSKGFGSFYLSENDKRYVDNYPLNVIKRLYPKGYYMEYNDADYDTEDPLNINSLVDINNIYNLLKKGFNYPDHPKTKIIQTNYGEKKVPDLSKKGINQMFYRSFLHSFWYSEQKPPLISNEKRFMKYNFFGKGQGKLDGANAISKWDNKPLQEFQFIRAILGVNDSYEFLLNNGKKDKITVKSNVVERYKSPITFKVINHIILIIVEFDKSILNQEFIFSFGRNEKNIFTPSEFDMDKLISCFIDYYNNLKVDNENNAKPVESMLETLNAITKIKTYANK